MSELCGLRRSLWLLWGHREQHLRAEHASGPEAGFHDPHHALPPGAPATPGETPDQEAGGHLAQQDGEQGCGHFPPQNITGCQSQPAGKWWQFVGSAGCNNTRLKSRRLKMNQEPFWLEQLSVFSRNTWLRSAWPRLWTKPRLTCPTSPERRTCTSRTSSTRQPWNWTWMETRSTPASSAPTSWGTPNFST